MTPATGTTHVRTGTFFPDGRQDTPAVRIRVEHGVAAGENPLAPWVVVGHCTRCGMPYFVNTEQIGGERPPYVWRTCTCFAPKKRKQW